MSKHAKSREQFETDIDRMLEYKVRLRDAQELHREAQELDKRLAAAVAEGSALRKRASYMLERVKESDPRQHFMLVGDCQTLYFAKPDKPTKNICYHSKRECDMLKHAKTPIVPITVADSESRLYRKCQRCQAVVTVSRD